MVVDDLDQPTQVAAITFLRGRLHECHCMIECARIIVQIRVCTLTLLWQNVFAPLFFKDLFSAIRALLKRRSKDEIDDGVTYGGHGWLRRRPVDSFFSAPRVRGDGVAGRRRQS